MTNQPNLLADITEQPQAFRALVANGPQRWDEALRRLFPQGVARPRRAILTGMGSSYFAALGVAPAWNRWGLQTTVELTSGLLHYGQGRLQRGDLVVAVSQSGESAEVVGLVGALAGSGVTVLGVTNRSDSSLAGLASASLVMDVPADRSVAVKSHGASLLTLLYLGLWLAQRPLDAWQAGADQAIAGLTQDMTRGEEWRRLGRSLVDGAPGGRPAVAVLGRGPLLSATYEGALLFNEVSKIPAWAEDGGEFRHGVIEVGEPGMIAAVLTTPGPTGDLGLSLIAELLRTGCRVLACLSASLESVLRHQVGPVKLDVLTVSDLPEDFAPLAHVLPFQWMSLGLAEARGLVPGLFRATPPVIREEK